MAVPSAWVDTKELICKWPPYSNADIKKAIIDIDEVAENWDTLSIIRVFGKSVHDTNNNILIPRQNTSDVGKTFEKSVRVAKTHDISKIPNNDISEKLNYIIGLEEENVKKNNAILQEIKEIRKVMINFRTKTYNDPTVQAVEESINKETNLNNFFPLDDHNALEALEEKLKNRIFQKDVMTLLAKRGGRNANELINNILAKVFTNSFATQYSYYGKRKKKALSELKITKCIIVAYYRTNNTGQRWLLKSIGGRFFEKKTYFPKMNYYVPIQENETRDKPTVSQPRHTPRILKRRFPLTATSYKYLEMGISIGSEPFVEILLGDNKGNHIILPYTTWQKFIERRVDVEELVRATIPSSRLFICDLVMEIVNVHDKNIVKLILCNIYIYIYIYMKPLTILFLLNLEHCVESMYNQLYKNNYSVSDKYKHFVNLLRQNYITNKCDALKLLFKSYDKTCIIDCELVTYASDNIVHDALRN
ncbi:uncharacterized protein LOC105832204 isoform X2 [Monomorium pharaonis]|nr:uncharacterized protein LOC105832204 isoform X2 [Monomorium pharaonis]XP_036139760.1 uncharacterized protein LOC105832204 isoform X2 [Monomorium pharaonis]